jgi:hypothetical protein
MRRHFWRRPLSSVSLFAAAIVLPLTGATMALAYWSGLGTGTGSASVATLSAPTAVTVTPQTRGAVSVSWSKAVAPDGSDVTRYSVRRFAGASHADACGTTPSSPLTSPPTSCTDTSVADGTYNYEVTAEFRSWTVASAASASVIVIPDAPTSVSLGNGGGAGGLYVNAANRSTVIVDVVVGARSLSSDTIKLSIRDGGSQHTLTRSVQATAGAGTVVLAGLDLSSFADGNLSFTATATDTAGRDSSSILSTATKDVLAPTATATCNGTVCPPTHTYILQSVGVVISATDTGGAGPASVTYILDGLQTTVNAPTATFTVSSIVASHTVSYFATDLAGNLATTSTFTFNVIL